MVVVVVVVVVLVAHVLRVAVEFVFVYLLMEPARFKAMHSTNVSNNYFSKRIEYTTWKFENQRLKGIFKATKSTSMDVQYMQVPLCLSGG